ncbi:hypothetical protein BJX64DRAFT_271350 [Aspergillus heterothallicus]
MDNYTSLNWKDNSHPFRRDLRTACLDRVNWTALTAYASALNNNIPCTLLTKSTTGGVHLIRILEFADTNARTNTKTKIHWIARVQLEPSTPSTATALRAEIATMQLIRAQAGKYVPVPEIFGYEVDDANCVGAAFILMEILPGSSAMDACGGWEVHRGRIPDVWRRGFYREMAGIQVHLSGIRMAKIGTIVKQLDGSFGVGPLPGLGGPFDTATEFFRAWATHAEFPLTDERIRNCMKGGPVEEVLSSIRDFPRRLHELASRIALYNEGPFPLYHPDLYQSNVIVDDSFRVLGVIDWEGACTVPWEMVQPPLFLSVLPRAMDDPSNYDASGGPKDQDSIQRLKERDEYVQYVGDAEKELGIDNMLSTVLSDGAIQGLAYAIKVYLDPGKMGFYCNALEPFDS